MTDAVAEFIGAMEAAGVRPVEPIAQPLASGNLIRFRCEGDKPGRRNGWAVLHLDGRPAGAFGCYRLGLRQKWRGEGSASLTASERNRMRREWREKREQRERERRDTEKAAALAASSLWASAGPVNVNHPYLVRKQLPGEGLRQDGDALLVPMRDIDGRLWNLQRIYGDGFKRFLKGGRTRGLLCLVGGGGGTLCLGEGYSTMAAVRAATGLPVAAALSGENVEPVARLIRQRWPGLDLVICADDDRHLIDNSQIGKNLGLEYATSAAAAVSGRLAIPRAGGA